MKLHLHRLAVNIFSVQRNTYYFEREWIPRKMNDQADCLSKVIDHEDWTVKDVYFQERFPVRDYMHG